MRDFARLYLELDGSTSTLHKVQALRGYLARADDADAAWAVYFLAGGKPRQTVPTALLRRAALEAARLPEWLFEESYQAVGDLAETIALVLPPAGPQASAAEGLGLAGWVEQRLLNLRGLPPDEQVARLQAWWAELDGAGRFLLTKLIGGGFRVGVSKLLVQRAIAEQAGLEAALVAQRMMGYTDANQLPTAARYAALRSREAQPQADAGQPYPFFLAHPVEGPSGGEPLTPAQLQQRLGPADDWLVEWKYDGIRAQLVRRAGRSWLWSRGEELVSDRFPEITEAAHRLPDGCVLDGEIVVWSGAPPTAAFEDEAHDGRPAPFALLQQRIGRKTLTKKVLAQAPVLMLAYDLLEWDGQDVRAHPQHERRALLERLCAETGWPISPRVQAADWAGYAQRRQASRERSVEGFMLKHRDAAYGIGRRKVDAGGGAATWWKWKIAPMSVDAVLVYAQRGHGRRASVYTDYTFAVWSRAPADAAEARAVVEAIAARQPAAAGALQLTPFAKAYSGLTDAEFAQVDRVIRATTLEKFGPVRSVVPSLVFELGFEGINRSPRHKSGIAVRFPRMLRLRPDKPLHEADTLDALRQLLGETVDGAP